MLIIIEVEYKKKQITITIFYKLISFIVVKRKQNKFI